MVSDLDKTFESDLNENVKTSEHSEIENKISDYHNDKYFLKFEIQLRKNNIKLSLEQVLDSSSIEFNDLLFNFNLNKKQIRVVKEMRKKVQNKVAAQKCRKRMFDSMTSLKKEISELKETRNILLNENDYLI